MGALIPLAAPVAIVAPAPALAQGIARWQPYIAAAAKRCGVPAAWIETVMRLESRGDTTLGGRPIVSRAGAMGLMQLMPATWATMRETLGLGTNPFDPYDNIVAGACYLRMMYGRFGYPGLFAAYNAGPGRYAAYLYEGRPLPGETVGYATAAGAPVIGPVMSVRIAAPPTMFVRRDPRADLAPATASADTRLVGPTSSQPTVFAIAPRDP